MFSIYKTTLFIVQQLSEVRVGQLGQATLPKYQFSGHEGDPSSSGAPGPGASLARKRIREETVGDKLTIIY